MINISQNVDNNFCNFGILDKVDIVSNVGAIGDMRNIVVLVKKLVMLVHNKPTPCTST